MIKFLPSSYEEVYGKWFENNSSANSDRVAEYAENATGSYWWLRSPSYDFNLAAYVGDYGYVYSYGVYVFNDSGIRPAFRLDQESVLFASDAAGGKSDFTAETAGKLAPTTVASDAVKLTVIDETVAAPEIVLTDGNETDTLEFSYTGAATGTGQYISAVLVDEYGEVVYYGKLGKCDTDEGDFELLSTGVSAGTYTLKIFYEECHDDYETDYAGLSVDRTLVVSADGSFEVDFDAPDVVAIDPADGAVDVLTDGTTEITFSEPIDIYTEKTGSVSLAETGATIGETLENGQWSASEKYGENTVYTLEYSGLSYDTEYTITVDEFYDCESNQMKEAFTSTFTTEKLVDAETPIITGEPKDTSYTLDDTANSLEVTASVSDGGTLSYQWYRNTSNSTSGGEKISGATDFEFMPPTDTVGICYYYVVVTNTNTEVNGTETAMTTSNVVTVTVKEAIPTAAIDYEEELLTGLVDGASYRFTIGTSNTTETIDGDTYAIEEAWMNGEEFSIVRVSAVAGCNSEPQKLIIPARPDAPDVSGEDETTEGAGDGKITGTADTMEYSADDGETWKTCPDGDMEDLSPGTYLIRYKAVAGESFASKTKSVEIQAAVDAETPVITSEPTAGTYSLNDTATALTVEVEALSDAGNLSYQWYRSDTDSNTNGTKIDEATDSSYTPRIDEVGICYYYVVVTNRNDAATGKKEAATVSKTAKITVKEVTPTAAIDYEQELLTGLVDGASYRFTIGTSTITEMIDGDTYAIDEAWMNGEELSIVRVSKVAGCNSDPQKLTIPVRPDAPDVSGVNETAEGANNGKIIGTDATMEYSTDNGERWKDCPDGDMEDLSPGTYLIRYKAVAGESFTGKTKKVEIQAAVDAVAPVITSEPTAGTYSLDDTATPLTVEVEALDAGKLSYQWYRSDTDSNTNGTVIDKAVTSSYTPRTDEVGICYYYVVVTNTNEAATGKKAAVTVSKTAKITVKEATPTAAIDYEQELLTGLVDGASYRFTIGTSTITETIDGDTYAIDEAWMKGAELSIVRVSKVAGCNSDPQKLKVPARPEAPDVSGEDETTEGANNGKIIGTDATMEYSTDNGESWKDCKDGDMEDLSPGTYLIRYKAVAGESFTGKAQKVVLRAAADAQTPDIVSHPRGGDYILHEEADALTVEASVSDGGSLRYQWYYNANDRNDGGTKIEGATAASYRPSTDTEGTLYYYVVVTNTNTGVSGKQTATAVSDTAAVTVSMSLTVSSGTAVVGTEVAITPSAWEAGGTWTYDNTRLKLLADSDGKGTFLPLLDGSTTVTYENTKSVTGTLQLTIEKGIMSGIYAVGWSGAYDGAPHSITVNGIPEGATVEYSLDAQKWQVENPAYTEQDTEVTVSYRVVKAGYHTVSGSAVIRIGECEHIWIKNEAVTSATCTEQGRQGYTCQICEEEKSEEIPAAGHRWGTVKTTPATCEADGRTWQTCEVCEEEQTIGIQLATGHSFGDWYEVVAATEEAEGSQRRDCADCEEYELRTIGKLEKLVLEGIPEHQTIRIGESFTLIPSADDRTGSEGWEWDAAYFDATFNSPATFTALRAGVSTITYTAADGRSISLDVTITAAEEPEPEGGSEDETKTEPEEESQQPEEASPQPKEETDKTTPNTNTTGAPVTDDTAPLRLWLLLFMLGFIGLSATGMTRCRRGR